MLLDEQKNSTVYLFLKRMPSRTLGNAATHFLLKCLQEEKQRTEMQLAMKEEQMTVMRDEMEVYPPINGNLLY